MEENTLAPCHQARWEKIQDDGSVRYYQARIIQDLLGDWTVFCSWGRKEYAGGGSKTLLASNQQEAVDTLQLTHRKRLARGYVPVLV